LAVNFGFSFVFFCPESLQRSLLVGIFVIYEALLFGFFFLLVVLNSFSPSFFFFFSQFPPH